MIMTRRAIYGTAAAVVVFATGLVAFHDES